MRNRFFKAAVGCLQALTPLLCLCVPCPAQVASITTSLLGRIDGNQVKPGSPFFVKVISEWKQGGCRLKEGDTLEGQVADAQRRSPATKRAELLLRFLPVHCAGDGAREMMPILVALEASQLRSNVGEGNREAMIGALGAMVGTDHSGRSGTTGSGAMSGAMEASLAGPGASLAALDRRPLRTAEVRGLSGVKLTLPTLTTDPTSLSASHGMLLEPGTRFILIVQPGETEHTASNLTPAKTDTPPPPVAKPIPIPPPEEPADVQTCVAGGCALADSPPLHGDGQVERRFSLKSLGYRTRSTRRLLSLTEDASVRFLGEDQLLVAFDAHPLIPRTRAEAGRDIRVIRALLLSTRSGKVLRAQDWRIESSGPYLWPLANGRLLAHLGNALIVYGPGLKMERQWTLSGDLAALRIAPSRRLLVAVVIHERHTPDQHRRLAEFLGSDSAVEEDYDLTTFDDQLNVVGTKRMTVQPAISQVLDTGLVFAERGVMQRWNVFEIGWNKKRRDIVRIHSACPLRVETLPTNLILLVGCVADESHSWYSVVRTDGRTLLDGATPNNNWLEGAEAQTGGSVFAIGIVEATQPIDFVDGMLASDFQKIAVSVYNSANGQRLFAAQSVGEAVNRQSFALNESGDRLAILSGEDVSLYKIDSLPLVAGTAGRKR